MLLCGGLRSCILCRADDNTESQKKTAKCIGVSIITVLTIFAAIMMELSHLKVWTEWFEAYAPHYSETEADDIVAEIDTLNIAKTTIVVFVIIFGLVLRWSNFLLQPFVAIFGSPFFIYYYCKWSK